VYVLDVIDPLHPVEVCQLLNAVSGRFVSGTKIAFWYSTFVGTADLQTGSLNWSRAWVDAPIDVVFSPNGSDWVYREGDESNVRTHLVVAGKDTVLVTRAVFSNHLPPPYGLHDQVAFSATGEYLLTYAYFVPTGAPPHFMVFALDGSTVFKSPTAKFGTWDVAGNRLYFLAATNVDVVSGTVQSLDPGGKPVVRSPKLSSYFWPSLSPDGKTMAFNSYGAQGFPHPWKLDIASRVRTQAATATSSQPVFVAPDVIWSTEGIPCACGPSGTSAPDGRVIGHNMRTGVNSVVLGLSSLTQSKSPTGDIVDVWFG
jgi:WD40-like Beta Propeller Repeat